MDKPCKFYNSETGCKAGRNCRFIHEKAVYRDKHNYPLLNYRFQNEGSGYQEKNNNQYRRKDEYRPKEREDHHKRERREQSRNETKPDTNPMKPNRSRSRAIYDRTYITNQPYQRDRHAPTVIESMRPAESSNKSEVLGVEKNLNIDPKSIDVKSKKSSFKASDKKPTHKKNDPSSKSTAVETSKIKEVREKIELILSDYTLLENPDLHRKASTCGYIDFHTIMALDAFKEMELSEGEIKAAAANSTRIELGKSKLGVKRKGLQPLPKLPRVKAKAGSNCI
jgi:hypothetical protein